MGLVQAQTGGQVTTLRPRAQTLYAILMVRDPSLRLCSAASRERRGQTRHTRVTHRHRERESEREERRGKKKDKREQSRERSA